jgi:hypothetical protein
MIIHPIDFVNPCHRRNTGRYGPPVGDGKRRPLDIVVCFFSLFVKSDAGFHAPTITFFGYCFYGYCFYDDISRQQGQRLYGLFQEFVHAGRILARDEIYAHSMILLLNMFFIFQRPVFVYWQPVFVFGLPAYVFEPCVYVFTAPVYVFTMLVYVFRPCVYVFTVPVYIFTAPVYVFSPCVYTFTTLVYSSAWPYYGLALLVLYAMVAV